jgi:malic enzyme
VSVVVLTDGERVLGLGDLGAGGLAISEGKILLYTVCAGVPPAACLPLCLDVGTDNGALLDDPGYKGLRRARLRGPTYDALVAELVDALRARWPHCVLQWEDFGAHNAFALLERYRDTVVRHPLFRSRKTAGRQLSVPERILVADVAARSAASTTTSRAPRRWRWRAC